MKAVMGFLERAGFVRSTESNEPPAASTASDELIGEPGVSANQNPQVAPVAPVESQLALSLDDIYVAAGVPTSVYPAEKLLRLLDGLRMMDEATRRTAVAAMDAADDAWDIQSPISDAIAKVDALQAQVMVLRQGVEQAENETESMVLQVKAREVATVTDIRRQIEELEALMAREIGRSTQDQAMLLTDMNVKRESAVNQIAALTGKTGEFRLLIAQFASPTTVSTTAPKSGTESV